MELFEVLGFHSAEIQRDIGQIISQRILVAISVLSIQTEIVNPLHMIITNNKKKIILSDTK